MKAPGSSFSGVVTSPFCWWSFNMQKSMGWKSLKFDHQKLQVTESCCFRSKIVHLTGCTRVYSIIWYDIIFYIIFYVWDLKNVHVFFVVYSIWQKIWCWGKYTVWYDMIWHGMVWYDMYWWIMVDHGISWWIIPVKPTNRTANRRGLRGKHTCPFSRLKRNHPSLDQDFVS